jgi:cell division protein YceG involved in septum cleavage
MKKGYLIILILVLGITAGFLISQIYMDETYELTHVYETEVTVERGDSLWDFISIIKNRDSYDGHTLISYIVKYNDLQSKSLTVGQTLYIPTELQEVRVK